MSTSDNTRPLAHFASKQDGQGPTNIFRIQSEEQALELLEGALNTTLPDDYPFLIEIGDWVNINVYLPETPIESSMTPTMMAAFIDFQREIQHAHALLTTSNGDLRFLTQIEKERLEFRVKVGGGSSNYVTQLAKPIETIAQSAVSKMSPTEVFISVLTIAILVGGSLAWRSWLSHKLDVKKAEVGKEEKSAWYDLQKASLEYNNKSLEILTAATRRMPVVGEIEDALDSGKSSLVHAIGQEKGGRLQGISVSSELASEVTSTKRQQSVPTQIVGVYRVARVDSSVADGFRVTLTNLETEVEISASLQDAFVSDEHKSLIQAAEWSKRPIRVRLAARLLRDRPIDAVILAVETISAEPPPT